jgi:hypothetical protein
MYPKGFTRLSRLLKRFNLSLEILNTKLPYNAKITQNMLVDLLKIPRMSTFAIGAIINEGVSQMPKDSCFLNIGVWHGFTFLAGIIDNPHKRCIGVDNFSKFDGPKELFLKRFIQYKSSNHYFYDIDYKEYFTSVHKGQIGLYMYDGNHSYEDQRKGLQLAEPFFSDNCFILIDDINLKDPRQATLNFIQESSSQYRIILDETTCIGDHPTFWDGIMILQRVT